MEYKFVVDYYYLEGCRAFGSGIGHKGFLHPSFGLKFFFKEKVKVSPRHWPHHMAAVLILEGDHKDKVLWVEKSDLLREYK